MATIDIYNQPGRNQYSKLDVEATGTQVLRINTSTVGYYI